jgi:outer membrane lipoprotein-sorting protein
MAIMGGRTALTAFLALTCLATCGVCAQNTKGAEPANSVAVGVPGQETQASRTAGEMSSQQIELIDKVSAYFNQMNSLTGEFVQTSAGGSRLRGKFYVKRPGRFRFDYARPSRLVIVSDGRHVAIQDHDLKTDDRWELDQTPFGALLRQDVNLLRDARFVDVQETEDTIIIAFEDKNQQAPGPLKLFLAKKPTLELRKWMTKDLRGLDTLIELSNIARTDDFGPDLFKPAPLVLDRLR